MKQYIRLFLISSLAFLASCSKQNLDSSLGSVSFDYTPGDDISHLELGDYHYSFFFDKNAGYHAIDYHLHAAPYNSSARTRAGGYTFELKESIADTTYADDFFVDGVSATSFRDMTTAKQNAFAEARMGQEVLFQYNEKGQQEHYSVQLYFPRAIAIDTLRSDITRTQPSSNIGKLKLGNQLHYTPDLNNKSGVLVYMNYRGLKYDLSYEDIQNASQESTPLVQRFLYVPEDNGIIAFPQGFFAGVPDGGLMHIEITRKHYTELDLKGNFHLLCTGATVGISLALDR